MVDIRSIRYMDSLFPMENTNELLMREQRSMSKFNGTVDHSPSTHFGAFIGPSETRHANYNNRSYGSDSAFYGEGLPAFPGQNLNMGADYVFDQDTPDSGTRAALVGFTLNSHLTLDHGNGDWDYEGYLGGDIFQ